MTIDELQALVRLATGFGLGALAALAVGFALLRFYVPAYLSEKAKNLATREDIAAITHEIEGVRTQYLSLIEELKGRHQLRLAAVERRLQAHQEAFCEWRELMETVHTPKVHASVIKCQSWWEKNCVYLEPSVREAFVVSYRAASLHSSVNQPGTNPQLIKHNWQEILKFGDTLFEAIQLPGLSELEKRRVAVGTTSATDPAG